MKIRKKTNNIRKNFRYKNILYMYHYNKDGLYEFS